MAIDEKRLSTLVEKLRAFSPSKFSLIEKTVERHAVQIETVIAQRLPFNKQFADAFGDSLQTHHAMSAQAFTKDRTEYAMIAAFEQSGVKAEDSGSKTRQGYDIKVEGVPWSIKTQADKGIKSDEIHISKFMEMGKGKWETADDLPALRDRFMAHMADYERIFTLRYWVDSSPLLGNFHFYELVEIPKALMQEAVKGQFEWMSGSKQTPKPGYCRVGDGQGGSKFELYFDGGTERKLQIKHIKKQYCDVVATWKFLA